ncbi:MAG: hypothetical protein JST88_09305 [Bacteroidetes bacterium]|nr:hypothetical protein [Bacteroidota bacterium]
MVLLALFTKPDNAKGYTAMGVEREVWVDYIVKKFRKANGFMANFYSDDQYVIGGKTVHIPQPGSDPSVTKNPSSFPLTAAKRTDTEISYDLDLYATAPTHIQDAEKQEISYDKMDSVIGDHLAVVNTRIAEEHLIKSLNGLTGATSVIYTTGSSITPKISGQTGTRKAATPADLKTAVTKLKLMDVPIDDNLYAILDSNTLDEITSAMDATQWNAFNQYFNAKTGQIGKLYGLNIFERSSVAVSAAALSGGNLAVNAYGAAVGATDLATNMIYHKNSIARAMGEVDFYERIHDPLYLGDIYNASIRYGGRRRYTAGTGVIALCQGT